MRQSFPFNPTAVNGVGSWYNPATWEIVTGYNAAELQQKSAELDAQLAALNEEARATGTISDQTYQATVEHLASQAAETATIGDQLDAATVEGFVQGYQNELAVLESIPKYAGRVTGDVLWAVTSGVTGGAGSILGKFFGALPWWIWVGGATAVLIYLGGHRYVERKARAYFNR